MLDCASETKSCANTGNWHGLQLRQLTRYFAQGIFIASCSSTLTFKINDATEFVLCIYKCESDQQIKYSIIS